MATCKWCNAWGIFHTLSDNGLCRDCNVTVVNRVQIHSRRLMNLIRAMKKVENLEKRLEICEAIVDEAKLLCEFEELSIATVKPEPRKLVGQISKHRERLIENRDMMDSSDPEVREKDPLSSQLTLAESMDPLGRWKKREMA